MPISISCGECDKQLTIDDRFAGKRIKCPKCQSVIDVPGGDDDRPARRGRDEIADKPRGRTSADRRDEEDDKPSRRARDDEEPRGRTGRREEEDRPSRKASKGGDPFAFDDGAGVVKSKKGRKKGGLWLWLGLGGGGAFLLLSTCVCGGVLWYFDLLPFGSSLSTEMKYFPDDTQMVTTTRTDQVRKTKYYEATRGKFGNLEGGNLHGVKEEDVERSTTAMGEGGAVYIITTKRSLKADDVKSSMKIPGLDKELEFTEEKVGSYSLYAMKGLGSQAFCIPESRIVLVGPAETLRKILKRDKKPELSETFKKGYSAADFSCSSVTVMGGAKKGGGGMGMGMGKSKATPESMVMQVNYGSDHTFKMIMHYKNSDDAEEARKQVEEDMKKEPPAAFDSEANKERRKNARISKFGSTLTISTSVREQTLIDEINKRKF